MCTGVKRATERDKHQGLPPFGNPIKEEELANKSKETQEMGGRGRAIFVTEQRLKPPAFSVRV
jgi:hypothetical protein